MMVKLSYNLSEDMPFYEGLPKPRIESLYDFSKGNHWRSMYFTMNNHCGTHVDAPNHFCPDGRRISDYSLDELIFDKPAILEMPLSEDELIRPDHFRGIGRVRSDCDLLMIRTGFSRHRNTSPKIYIDRSPGFSRAGAEYLMKALPGIKALAVDFVSMSATAYPEEGADAHRVFLGYPGYSAKAILLVEDVWIPQDLQRPQKVYVVPLFFEGLDSAPCTVFANA